MSILLSILIPTLPEPDRVEFYKKLVEHIIETCPPEYSDRIEIITDDRPRAGKHGGVSTGLKRDALYQKANGEYSWPIDDDDWLFPNAIKNVFEACLTGADVIGINGKITSNGGNERWWEIRLGHPFVAEIRDGKEYYLRHPNHITPMKTAIARQIRFQDLTVFEDYHWAVALKESGLLKTQTIINAPVYYYRERSKPQIV